MIFGLMLAVVAALAPAEAVSIPPTKPAGLQASFDAATQDYVAGRCEVAVAAFSELAARPAVARNRAVLGSIEAREGNCLIMLGRIDDARTMLTAALADLPADSVNYRGDRFDANEGLGRLAYDGFDYPAATGFFRAALTLAESPADRISINIWLARTTMFDADDSALTAADAALADMRSTPDFSKKMVADAASLHARVLLVRGQPREALAELRKSLATRGGLTLKVSLTDLITRSDLALAALRSGDAEAARLYLAYTGAGRFEKAPFDTARRAEPPPCGGDIRPDDSAVIEFSVRDDGSTGNVHPIWASRRGPAAISFARAVAEWSWAPEDATKIPEFFRAVTRVELRCTTQIERPSPLAVLARAVDDWIVERRLTPAAFIGGEAKRLPLLIAELHRRDNAGEPLQAVPVLWALLKLGILAQEQRNPWADRFYTLVAEARAPVPVIARADIERLIIVSQGSSVIAKPIFEPLLANPQYANDAIVADTLRLMIIDARGKSHQDEQATLLHAVADDGRLPAQHPLRVAALVRLADFAARSGDLEAARASYARTGLDESQCALVGSAPAMTGYSNAAFPQEVQRWGFEGWVRFETDVSADGRSTNQRAIVSYPPFVFDEATLGIAKTMRFTRTYRPAGDAACTGYRSGVLFRIPK